MHAGIPLGLAPSCCSNKLLTSALARPEQPRSRPELPPSVWQA